VRSDPEILTIGHSTHEARRFLRLLRVHGVELLGDVRRYPSSRRHPQFNADSLADALADAGVRYERLGEELGGRRETSRRPAGPWRVAGFAAYAAHMATADFERGLARLEKLALERRTAIMCAEGDWRRCHRRLISDALLARRWRVVHIRPDGSSEEHQLPEFAAVAGGRVSYGAQDALDV
jgi:uncharacterized protein (DUF488 family)